MKFIYLFQANVKCRLRLLGYSYQENFDFARTWRYNTKRHAPKNRKMRLHYFGKSCLLNDMKVPCFNFNFLFRNNGKREQFDENDFRHCYGNFLRKCNSESKISFSKITRHLDNAIWTTPYSWRFYGHGST